MSAAPRYCPECGVLKASAVALGLHRRLAHGVHGDMKDVHRRYRQRRRARLLLTFLDALPPDQMVRVRVGRGRTRASRVAIRAGELRALLEGAPA